MFDFNINDIKRIWRLFVAKSSNYITFYSTGTDSISVYSSSEWAERGFCKQCGTHLFYRLKNSDFCNFSAGLFKEVENFKFHVQIYIDSKPSCYEFANKTEMMTEAEVIAKFSQN